MRKLWACAFLISGFLARGQEAPYTKKVKLGWDEVEKSQAYELEVFKGTVQIVKETIIALTWESRLEPGVYKYRVRALDEFSRYGKWTPFEEFTVKEPEKRKEPDFVKAIARSSASLGLNYGHFDYGSEIDGLGFGSAKGANDFSIEAEGQYWFWKYFSAGVEASYVMATLSGVDVNYTDFAAVFRYSVLRNSRFYIYPVLSLNYVNTPELLSSSSATIPALEGSSVKTMGIGAGAEAGWQFSNSWIAGGSFRYIWPMSISGSNVEKGVTDSSTFYEYGIDVNYFLNSRWSVGLKYTYEYRKVSYDSGIGRNNLYKDAYRLGLTLKALFGDPK